MLRFSFLGCERLVCVSLDEGGELMENLRI
jgi:hypothetical protein